ncbi:MAG: hypothetical protein ACI9QL_002710, partial [Candidatus Omnitrophota bacterium]
TRYIYDDSGEKPIDIGDFGLRLLWESGDEKYLLSGEYTARFADGEQSDSVVGILEYRVNDTLSLVTSYGYEFPDDFKGEGDLIAIGGVKFGFGASTKKDEPKS